MIGPVPLPAPDVLPVPGPIWLFQALLSATFFLHVLFMNVTVGGSLIAGIQMLRSGDDGSGRRLAQAIASCLPVTTAFTITLGVAPLLFLQVLYGHLFYSSAILLGLPWIAIIPLLIAGYAGLYYAAFRRTTAAGLLGCTAVFALIGFFFSSTMSLMIRPALWEALYARSTVGWNLNLGDPAMLPRYLHFMVAAAAIGGAFVSVLGLRSPGFGATARDWFRTGAHWFTGATALQMVVGVWFLLSLPAAEMQIFLGGQTAATVYFAVGLLLVLAALALVSLALIEARPHRQAYAGYACILGAIICMVLMRDALRRVALAPYFSPQVLETRPEWGLIVLFLALCLLGLATVGWMVTRFKPGVMPSGIMRPPSADVFR